MGLFDLFKKKKEVPSYDVTDLQLSDLQIGFVFDYDLTNWIVEEVGEYDWGNNHFSHEFKMTNGSETRFLEVEDDDESSLILTKKVKIRAIAEDLPEQIVKQERPPAKLQYEGKIYYMESEAPGYYHIEGDESWDELLSWTYEDQTGESVLCIERWGDWEFEASVGRYIEAYEITNILPSGTTL